MAGGSTIEQCQEVMHDLSVILNTIDGATDDGIELWNIVDGCVADMALLYDRLQGE